MDCNLQNTRLVDDVLQPSTRSVEITHSSAPLYVDGDHSSASGDEHAINSITCEEADDSTASTACGQEEETEVNLTAALPQLHAARRRKRR